MSDAAEKLKAQLLELPESERLDVANFLFESLPPPPGVMSEDDPGFMAVLNRRMEELDSGKVKGIPAEVVMERLRRKYQR